MENIYYVKKHIELCGLLRDNLKRGVLMAHKKKDFNRVKRIGNSLGEVYQLVYQDGGVVEFTHINGRWVFENVCFDVEAKVYSPQFTILSDHAIERYRGRLNMWATPIQKVLYDIVENYINAKFGTNERFAGGYAILKNGSLFVLETEGATINGTDVCIRLVKTILDQPDKKIDQATKEVNEIVDDSHFGKVATICGDKVIMWDSSEDTEVMVMAV